MGFSTSIEGSSKQLTECSMRQIKARDAPLCLYTFIYQSHIPQSQTKIVEKQFSPVDGRSISGDLGVNLEFTEMTRDLTWDFTWLASWRLANMSGNAYIVISQNAEGFQAVFL